MGIAPPSETGKASPETVQELATLNPSLWEKIQNWLGKMSTEDMAKEMNNISSILKGLTGLNKKVGQSEVAQKLMQEHQVLQSKAHGGASPTFGATDVGGGATGMPPVPNNVSPEVAAGMLQSMGLR
jgi:hypothetical protein